MSYNICRFGVKKIKNFKFNEASEIEEPEIFEIYYDEKGYVEDIDFAGERSGRYWDGFYELLKDSTGYLKAIIVWEDGDSVIELTIDEGIAKTERLI